MAVPQNMYFSFDVTATTSESLELDMKFSMELDHNHTYKICMKYRLQANKHKCYDGGKLVGREPI